MVNGEKGKKILVGILTTKPLKITRVLKDSSTLAFYSVSNTCLEVNGVALTVDFGLAFPH